MDKDTPCNILRLMTSKQLLPQLEPFLLIKLRFFLAVQIHHMMPYEPVKSVLKTDNDRGRATAYFTLKFSPMLSLRNLEDRGYGIKFTF